jgi:hypothetical protein
MERDVDEVRQLVSKWMAAAKAGGRWLLDANMLAPAAGA